MANFQPPPTYAPLELKDDKTGQTTFNPIWLDWFISLTASLGTAGPITTVTASAPLASSGGNSPNITLNQAAMAITGGTINGTSVGATTPTTVRGTTVVATTSIQPTAVGGYLSSDSSAGISTTITTGSLVGKTITVKDGIITGFA